MADVDDGAGGVDARAAPALFARRGWQRVHSEGGPTVLAAWMAAGRLAELMQVLAAQCEALSEAGTPAGWLMRLRSLMEAARTLVQLADEAGADASALGEDPSTHAQALIRVRDIVLAELEAQMTPEAFLLWSDMYTLA